MRIAKFDLIASAILIATIFAVLWADREFAFLTLDTDQFHALKDEITSGRLFTKYDGPEPHLGVVIRTPPYPLVMILGEFISPANYELGIKLVYSAVAVASISTILFAFRRMVPFTVPLILLLSIFSRAAETFSADTSEWLTLNALLVSIAIVLMHFRNQSNRSQLAVAGICGLLPLVHPSFILSLVATAAVIIFSTKTSKCALALVFLPAILWMSLNYYRFQTFVLTPYSSLALFTIGSTVSNPALNGASASKDSPFIETDKLEAAAPDYYYDLATIPTDETKHRFLTLYNSNMLISKANLQKEGTLIKDQYKLLKEAGLKKIKANFSNYIRFLWYNFQSPKFTYLLLVPSLLLPLVMISRKKHLALCYTVITSLAIHLLHIGPILGISPMIARYFAVSFYLVFFTSGILTYLYIKSTFISAPLLNLQRTQSHPSGSSTSSKLNSRNSKIRNDR